jgi:hypothetical protein
MKLRNPYTNRNRIRSETEFFGRENELRGVYTRLLGGASVSLVGERRTGKSSLLGALNFSDVRRDLGIPEELRVAYTDCQEMAGCGEDQLLDYLCVTFATAMDLQVPEPIDRAAFKKLGLDARFKAGLQPVLAIDEFDVLLENDRLDRAFLAFLRSWSSGAQVPIVLASWEGSINDLAESEGLGSAFLNVFAPVYVGPLEPDDAEDLVRLPAEGIGEPFEEEEIRWVRAFGGLHPFFLQMASYHMLESRRASGPGPEALALAEKNFIYDATPHLRFLEGRLTPEERGAMADWLGSRSGKPCGEGYERLLRKGILISDPELRVFSKGFERVFELAQAS